MDAVNAAMKRIFDALWAPFGSLPLWVGVLVLGVAFGVLALTDADGTKVLLRVDKRDEVYHGDQLDHAPDLVLGYNRGYGASDDAALGKLVLSATPKVLADNKSRWSGNHLMAPEVVPGVFLTNRKNLQPKDANLVDVTATMLSFFGVPSPPQARGKTLF